MSPQTGIGRGRCERGGGPLASSGRADETDPYREGDYLWWHLSRPSPELRMALDRGWLPDHGRTLDLGCGLAVEARHLAERGFMAVGVDLSAEALRIASTPPSRAHLVQADVRRLPFPDATFDALLDRFCFHWVAPEDEPRYEAEARRVLRPGGRLLLRTCLQIAGVRSEISEETLRRVFRAWRFLKVERRALPTDTREIDALFLLLERP